MKHLWSAIAMLFVFVLTPMEAEAKKFGGGKSFGSSHQTSPAPAPAARPDAANSAQAAPANAGRKGMLGGLLGGLLAGGLLASLFGSDLFEGIQFMDILIFGLLAFVIFRLLRRKAPAMQQQVPAYSAQASAQPSAFDSLPPARDTLFGGNSGSGISSGMSSGNDSSIDSGIGGGFTASSVPFNLPGDFDMNGFLAGARDHYRTLQDAWNKNDLTKIQEYVVPSLYNELREERATLPGDQHTEVLFVDAELVRADHTTSEAELSVRFSGRYRDTHDGVEEPITDIWHLKRDLTYPNAPWLIIGIED